MAENEYISRKIKDMERENKDMKERREKGRAEFERIKAQKELQEKKNKEF